MKAALVIVLLALSGAAYAGFNNCGVGFCPGAIFGGTGFSRPGSTNKILLADGVAFLLQTDADSKVCLAGGC